MDYLVNTSRVDMLAKARIADLIRADSMLTESAGA